MQAHVITFIILLKAIVNNITKPIHSFHLHCFCSNYY
jgi:hypothetical protein